MYHRGVVAPKEDAFATKTVTERLECKRQTNEFQVVDAHLSSSDGSGGGFVPLPIEILALPHDAVPCAAAGVSVNLVHVWPTPGPRVDDAGARVLCEKDPPPPKIVDLGLANGYPLAAVRGAKCSQKALVEDA